MEPETALWVGAIGELFTFLPVALSSIRSMREMPAAVTEPTQAQAELAGGLVEGGADPGPAAADAYGRLLACPSFRRWRRGGAS